MDMGLKWVAKTLDTTLSYSAPSDKPLSWPWLVASSHVTLLHLTLYQVSRSASVLLSYSAFQTKCRNMSFHQVRCQAPVLEEEITTKKSKQVFSDWISRSLIHVHLCTRLLTDQLLSGVKAQLSARHGIRSKRMMQFNGFCILAPFGVAVTHKLISELSQTLVSLPPFPFHWTRRVSPILPLSLVSSQPRKGLGGWNDCIRCGLHALLPWWRQSTLAEKHKNSNWNNGRTMQPHHANRQN